MIGKPAHFLSLNIAKVEFEGYFRHGRGSVRLCQLSWCSYLTFSQNLIRLFSLKESGRPKGSRERLVLSSYHAGLVKLEKFREDEVKK